MILGNGGRVGGSVWGRGRGGWLGDSMMIGVKGCVKVILWGNVKGKEEGCVLSGCGVMSNGWCNLGVCKGKMGVIIFVVVGGWIILCWCLGYNRGLWWGCIKEGESGVVWGLGKVFGKGILEMNKDKVKIIGMFFKEIKIKGCVFM